MELIRPGTKLNRIAVEGAEEPNDSQADYVIDLALYWDHGDGDEKFVEELIQYKHSLQHPLPKLHVSDIRSFLTQCAIRENASVKSSKVVRYRIETNRPCAPNLRSALNVLARGDEPGQEDQDTYDALISCTKSLDSSRLQDFFGRLKVNDENGGSLDIELAFRREAASLTLPGSGSRAIQQELLSLICSKVRRQGTSSNVISANDVLAICNVDRREDLYPAPDAHIRVDWQVSRACFVYIARVIQDAARPVIIHAAGGLGKSELLRQITTDLPQGSQLIVFDGFGGGRYRDPDDQRHRPARAVLQIINDMAQWGLCDLVLPDPQVPDYDWMRRLKRALEDGVARLRAFHPAAILVLGLDAADNSCDLATQNGQEGVVRQILNLKVNEGVRVVATARTERLSLLGDPGRYTRWEVPRFNDEETTVHVGKVFPGADATYVADFAARTARNPRVQAFALRLASAQNDPAIVWQVLDGQPPRDPQVALDRLFGRIVDKAQHRNGDNSRVEAMLRAIVALTQFWWRWRLRGADDASLKQVDLSSAVHLPFHELEFSDLAFGLSVGPWGDDCRPDRHLIFNDAVGERGE